MSSKTWLFEPTIICSSWGLRSGFKFLVRKSKIVSSAVSLPGRIHFVFLLWKKNDSLGNN